MRKYRSWECLVPEVMEQALRMRSMGRRRVMGAA
jgi:hypothetical protein